MGGGGEGGGLDLRSIQWEWLTSIRDGFGGVSASCSQRGTRVSYSSNVTCQIDGASWWITGREKMSISDQVQSIPFFAIRKNHPGWNWTFWEAVSLDLPQKCSKMAGKCCISTLYSIDSNSRDSKILAQLKMEDFCKPFRWISCQNWHKRRENFVFWHNTQSSPIIMIQKNSPIKNGRFLGGIYLDLIEKWPKLPAKF